MNLNEALTRIRLIDPQLRQAEWRLDDKTQVRREIPVDGYDAEPWNGVTDYCLYEPSGQVLAVVEAKRCSRNPREADEQLRHYVTEIAKRQSFAPFGFMTNGHATHFWEVGLTNPRLVAGYYVVWDPANILEQGTLQAFELRGEKYKSLKEVWFPEIALGMSIWHGQFEDSTQGWLRWCNRDGALLPTADERAEKLSAQLRALGVEPQA
jgi:type I site-specific restriction endonuclease